MAGFRPPVLGGELPTDNFSGGYFDYDDSLTAVTPIVVIGGAGPVALTNNELGIATLKTYAPNGCTDVWNASGGVFDWSQLSLGDEVWIRLDIDVITASANTEIQVDLHLAGGLFDPIPWKNLTNYKISGTQRITEANIFHIGVAQVLNGGGQFKIMSDKDCTVIVRGWYCSIRKRGS